MITATLQKGRLHLEVTTKDEYNLLIQDCFETATGFLIDAKVKVSTEITKKTIEAKIKEIEDWVLNTYRKIFKGIKRGSMGDRHDCLFKMALFSLVYPEYSLDKIEETSKAYVERNRSNPTFMRQANYFIFKQKVHQGRQTIVSDLLTELEEGDITYHEADMFDSIN